MVNVGLQENFVDAQESTLTNRTQDLTYIQITDTILNIDSNVTKHQLTDNTIDNVFSRYMASMQGNMWVTLPEWLALTDLTVDVNGTRPVNVWELKWISQADVRISTVFAAQMKTLQIIDRGIGSVQLFFRLELTEEIQIEI